MGKFLVFLLSLPSCVFAPGMRNSPKYATSVQSGIVGYENSKMAMHVPKPPGFAQMLKDGAKVL
jgi:hypothetical protein